MSVLNVALNLLSGNSFAKASGDVKLLGSKIKDTGDQFDKLKGKMNISSKLMGLASASSLISNFSSGIKNAVASVQSLVGTVGEYASQADRISKTSRLLGVTVQEYQALDQAARHAGMSTEEMDGALKKFNINLGKARSGDSKSLKAFDAILGGRNISEFKDTTSLLAAISDGYTKLGTAEQKAFVSQELFGKSGLKMSELLKDGGDELNKLLGSAIPGFSEQGAKDAEAFNDALQDMQDTIGGIKNSLMQELFPVFTRLFTRIKEYITENGSAIKERFNGILDSVVKLVDGILPHIPKVLNVVIGLVDVIGPGTLAILAGFTGILGAVLPLVPSLMAVAGIISGPVAAGIALGVVGIIAWKNAISSVIDNFDMLKSFIVDDVGGAIAEWGREFVAVGEWIWDSLKSGVSAVADFMYDRILGSINRAVSSIKSFLKDVPILGSFFGGGEGQSLRKIGSSYSDGGQQSLGASVGQTVSETRTTTTSRFSVDFKNMPKGVQVTPPAQGDFDYSRGYVLGGN